MNKRIIREKNSLSKRSKPLEVMGIIGNNLQ